MTPSFFSCLSGLFFLEPERLFSSEPCFAQKLLWLFKERNHAQVAQCSMTRDSVAATLLCSATH